MGRAQSATLSWGPTPVGRLQKFTDRVYFKREKKQVSREMRIGSEDVAKALHVVLILLQSNLALTSIVQTLSSRYAIVLGGYGPGYTELSQVEIVTHNRVCHNVVSEVPPALARFLGDTSGLAEFVDDKVMFC